jgi:hypothetical protein
MWGACYWITLEEKFTVSITHWSRNFWKGIIGVLDTLIVHKIRKSYKMSTNYFTSYITLCCEYLLAEATVLKIDRLCMELQSLFSCSQEPTNCPYHEPLKLSPRSHIVLLECAPYYIIIVFWNICSQPAVCIKKYKTNWYLRIVALIWQLCVCNW